MTCKSILVVEDDPEIRTVLRELLELEGYQVRTAENGRQALEVLPEMQPTCLILLDLMMPVMDGFEFLRLKQGNHLIAPIPVAIVSALPPDESNNNGVVRHIRKPVRFELLIEVVKQYCGVSG